MGVHHSEQIEIDGNDQVWSNEDANDVGRVKQITEKTSPAGATALVDVPYIVHYRSPFNNIADQ